MLYHCPNELCRYFSPNLNSLRFHLKLCVFRGSDSVSPYTTSPYSSPISAKRRKHEYASEPVGSHPAHARPCISKSVSNEFERKVLGPPPFDRSLKQLPSSDSLHGLCYGESLGVEKRDNIEQTLSLRKPEKVQSLLTSRAVLPDNCVHVETSKDLEPISSEYKKSTQEDVLVSKQQNSKQEPCGLLELESDDPGHTKAELQDMHLDYIAVCLASVANSMGERIADEIISALNHPFFDLDKFKKDVSSAHMCKKRTNSIAKRYVGFTLRQSWKSVKTKQPEDGDAL